MDSNKRIYSVMLFSRLGECEGMTDDEILDKFVKEVARVDAGEIPSYQDIDWSDEREYKLISFTDFTDGELALGYYITAEADDVQIVYGDTLDELIEKKIEMTINHKNLDWIRANVQKGTKRELNVLD